MSRHGSLQQRMADEVAKGRTPAGCVPLLLQQEAAHALLAMAETVSALGTGAVSPEEAHRRATAVLDAWNAQVGAAQALLQHPPAPARRRWWAWLNG